MRYEKNPYLRFEVMDVRKMSLSDKSASLVLDKGTADSIKCSQDYHIGMEDYLREVSRVLKPETGVFICISYGIPYIMLKFLNKPEYKWKIEIKKIAKQIKEEIEEESNEDDESSCKYLISKRNKESC